MRSERRMTTEHEQPRFNWLTRLALGLLLAIVVARCLMLEVAREAIIQGPTFSNGPGPTTSLFLDSLTFIPMLLILVRRVLDDSYTLRFRWVHLLFTLLAVWTLASIAWAPDRFLAMVGAMQIVAGASLFWSVSQLVRRWEHLRIVVGICVGLLLANVVQAAIYRLFDLPDLQNFWQQNKETFFAERGWKPGEFIATRFEKKLLAGELLGFNVSPNTLGALVVMLCLITLGAAMQRVEDKDDQGWIGILFLVAIAALFPLAYTGSKASWAALLLGIVLLALWRLLRKWLVAHRIFVFSVAMAGIALGIVSVVAYGLSFGGLPEDSINFRWRYWTAAWAGITQAPVFGVGWGNFASVFLQHRLPVSAEEISDPHNFLVRWAAELGIVGLVLGVSWLILWTWNLTRPLAIAGVTTPPRRVHRVLWIGLAAFFASLIAVDFSRLDESGQFFAALLDMLRRILLSGLVTLGLGILCLRDAEHREVDARPAPWLMAGMFVGVLAFLLQSGIDIAFFQTGPFMLCLLIMAALLGVVLEERARRQTAIATVSLVLSTLCVVIVLIAFVIPTAFAESTADYARRLAPNQPERAIDLYEKAYGQAPVRNADYLIRAAEIAQVPALNMEQRARELLGRAIDADPTSIKALTARGHLLAQRAANPSTIEQCLADYQRAVELNPNEIDLRLDYAQLLEHFGKPKEAATQLIAAMQVNSAYDPAEPERLELRAPGEVQRITAKIAALQAR